MYTVIYNNLAASLHQGNETRGAVIKNMFIAAQRYLIPRKLADRKTLDMLMHIFAMDVRCGYGHGELPNMNRDFATAIAGGTSQPYLLPLEPVLK
jgi:hypothetical protein